MKASCSLANGPGQVTLLELPVKAALSIRSGRKPF